MKTDFLSIKCGDFVVISSSRNSFDDWWVGQVIFRVGGSIDSSVNTLFQVLDLDTGRIKIVNAGFAKGISRMTCLRS